jgi:hypothetical protein
MAWEVEYADEFGNWWDSLTIAEQEAVAEKVRLLQEHGPVLPRPHSDVIVTSKHPNMKELRSTAGRAVLRILYAFDPRRTAVLLIGGDKSRRSDWYEKFVPIADEIFDKHLAHLKKK